MHGSVRGRTPVVLTAAALVAWLAGCASTKGEGPLDAAQGAVARLVLPVSQEKELGQQVTAQLQQELQLLDDPELVGWVNELGGAIVAAAGDDVPDGIEIAFHVVADDATVNAFAVPGGNIYVYTGLLRTLEDEAQLVGVLGHEVAHVTERHVAERLTAQYGLETLSALLTGGGDGVSSLVGQLAGTAVTQGFLLKYSRDHEREADWVGTAYAAGAGYDPRGLIDFFRLMQAQERSGVVPSFLLTHPMPDERLERVQERIEELQPVPERRGRERYQQMVARLGGPSK